MSFIGRMPFCFPRGEARAHQYQAVGLGNRRRGDLYYCRGGSSEAIEGSDPFLQLC
jgi:hypothetical protein